MNKTPSALVGFVAGVFISATLVAFVGKNPSQENEQDPIEISYQGPVLSQEHAESIVSIIRTEGLDYAFSHYAIYRDVNDTKFHDLRLEYIRAARELREYVYTKAGEQYDPKNYD